MSTHAEITVSNNNGMGKHMDVGRGCACYYCCVINPCLQAGFMQQLVSHAIIAALSAYWASVFGPVIAIMHTVIDCWRAMFHIDPSETTMFP